MLHLGFSVIYIFCMSYPDSARFLDMLTIYFPNFKLIESCTIKLKKKKKKKKKRGDFGTLKLTNEVSYGNKTTFGMELLHTVVHAMETHALYHMCILLHTVASTQNCFFF